MQKLFAKIDELNNFYIGVWKDICAIDSPTAYKEGVDRVGDYLIKLARERGFEIKILENEIAGNALAITINPDCKENPVVFSGHIDTVFPIGTFPSPTVTTDDEKIYGPGVMDCKGGVVASFMALDALSQCGFKSRPVKLIVQSDEETSSLQSGKKTIEFMIDESKSAAAFLNTEGTQGNTAVIERKGILRYRFNITGKAVHSSKCHNGANAICEAAHKIIKLEQMKDMDGLTCNCGIIEGGTVANTVAEKCSFTADIRFANNLQYDEAVRICEETAKQSTVSGCSCELVKVSERPAMPPCDKNIDLLSKMNEIYKSCGLPTLEKLLGEGGSDAAYTTQADIPTVDSIGVDGGDIHSIREYARLDSLSECAKRLAAIAFKL